MPDKPTSAADWNTPTGDLVTLPSGNVARVRASFPVYLLLRTGAFTPELWKAFQDWTDGVVENPEMAGPLVDFIVTRMVIEPRVTTDGADGTVAMDDIAEDDIDAILTRAAGGTLDAGFPDEPVSAGDSADSEVLGDDTVVDARPAARNDGGTRSGSPSRRKAAVSPAGV